MEIMTNSMNILLFKFVIIRIMFIYILLLYYHCIHASIISKSQDKLNFLKDSNDNCLNSLLQWSNITIDYKKRRILSLSKGNIYSCRVLGVLGSSGCGKSTLLNVLANRLNQKEFIKIADVQSGNTPLLSNEIAFVYQKDTFFSMLTVKETLELAALLRLRYPTSTDTISSQVSISQEVDSLLHALSLSHVSSSIVGTGNNEGNDRGISGGELKRLSIASEIIGSPKLLLADEPTSGLDSYQSLQVMKLIKQLAIDKNLAAVATIHQPRTSIWNILDDIMLLSPNGRCVYHGRREDALAYFKALGFSCPSEINPAEFLIDLVSIDSTSSSSVNLSWQRINALINSFESYQKNKILNIVQYPSEQEMKKSMSDMNPLKRIFVACKRSFCRFCLLFKRSTLQTLRDMPTNIVRVLTTGVLALALFAVYGKQSNELTHESVSDRIMILTNAVVNISLLSMIKTLQLFKRERSVVSRERLQRQYYASEYLFGKLFAEIPWDIAVSSFFGSVLYFTTNLHCSLKTFLSILSLVSVVTSTLGLAIGALFQKGDEALSIGPGLMIVFLIVGAIGPTGVGDKLPNYLLPLRTLSPIRWGCEGLCATEFKGQQFSIDDKSKSNHRMKRWITKLKNLKPCFSLQRSKEISFSDGDYTLNKLGIADANVNESSKVLWKMLVVNCILSWIGLVASGPKRK